MAAVLIILLLSAVAWRQTSHWRNSETLFVHGIAVTRDNARLHANLGMALRSMDRTEEAIPHLEEAVRIEPGLIEAHNNLAVAYYFASRYRDAWREVKICRELGLEPSGEFLDALEERMPEPAE
jgi:tetratricopeptide (TPR) repeat protein